ncbi:MAG TPA: hypothetical protein VJ249_04835 [Candidatus Bathyarchaeia archaeon]|nr:hypothetical protein [Candidatus Bathyarchaeia archaeon]
MDIVCRAPKELVILECTHYPSLEALSRIVAVIMSSGESVILKWAEGVVFSYNPIAPQTEVLVDEYIKGRIFWSDVVYALMPEYKQAIRVGTLDIPVIDVSPNPLLREAATWMKKHA